MASPSYYFTLFKKFQVVNHVPAGSVHGSGSPTGGFDLKNPAAAIGSSNRGALLGTTPANSPLWAILNAKAMGLGSVTIGATVWPAMPTSATPAWTAFQVSAPAPKLVQTFSDWITAGKVVDIPDGVIATMPGTISPLDAGVELFVCSVAGDNGIRPGTVPANYWATSLIFLVDPANGNTASPTELAGSSEYYLAAVIGNRGNTAAGQFNAPAAVVTEAAAWVMVWNSGASPSVQLPALSNLDVSSTNGVYEVYFLKPGSYEVVGFRLDVQTVFDGLAAAIAASGMDLGGLTPEEWIHAQGAHLCAKVLVRKAGEAWPSLGDTPFTNRRLAQKNLMPFAIDVAVVSPSPNIVWKNFVVGDVIQKLRGGNLDDRWGAHKLEIEGKLAPGFTRLLLAVPEKSFDRWFRDGGLRGLKRLSDKEALAVNPPFPRHVVFAFPDDLRSFDVPALAEEYLALAIGAEYIPKRLEVGRLGDLTVIQRTAVPKINREKGSYEIEHVAVGGFSIQLEAYDSREIDHTGFARGYDTK